MTGFSMRLAQATAAITLLASGVAGAQSPAESLPVIDLGYELHRAIDFNQTGGYYNFTNIRFGAPPLGDLRFRAPEPPATNRSVIQDGHEARLCPQSTPPWTKSATWLSDYLSSGRVPNDTSWEASPSNSSAAPQRDPRQTEDCLFLDVMVPQPIFESANKSSGAAVLVWIYGGGYSTGSKTDGYDPRGLLQRSKMHTAEAEGIVYVAINYRVGAFGWLSGPTFDGTANAGFHDQRLALNWVQDNIHLFGGDKNRVTVVGESAGGASIMHQLTAYGGDQKAPFHQAIIQSPGWVPYLSASDQESALQDFLRFANVDSLDAARSLASDALIDANNRKIAASPHGSFGWGPVVDGGFVTHDPKVQLAHGRFDSSVRTLAAHNSNEGLLFAPPITTDAEFRAYAHMYLRSASPAVVDHLAATLYPPQFDGAPHGYRDHVGRAAQMVAESTFVCNAVAMDRAHGNATHSYLFDVFPGVHAMDTAFTFFNADEQPAAGARSASVAASAPRNATVAFALQDYITSFAARGYPQSPDDGLPAFPVKQRNNTVVRLSSSGITEERDSGANQRCSWWQLAPIS